MGGVGALQVDQDQVAVRVLVEVGPEVQHLPIVIRVPFAQLIDQAIDGVVDQDGQLGGAGRGIILRRDGNRDAGAHWSTSSQQRSAMAQAISSSSTSRAASQASNSASSTSVEGWLS